MNEQYLTYEDYIGLGGTVDESAFPNLLRMAQRKLDYFTQDRIKKLTTIPSEVKELLTIYIDKIQSNSKNGNISSYSNGTESFSYNNNTPLQEDVELFRLAVEYLPIELISRVVD